jgi:hypothetical protein
MKTTLYFDAIRERDDRRDIRTEWVELVLHSPAAQVVQADWHKRRWAPIDAARGRYLRVVVLPDGETVHNAFFGRRFKP